MVFNKFGRSLAVRDNELGQVSAKFFQIIIKFLVILVLFRDFFILCHPVAHNTDHIIGGGITVNSDHIKGFVDSSAQGFIQQFTGYGYIAGYESQHSSHIRMDHAGPFGNSCHVDCGTVNIEGSESFFGVGISG